MSKDVKITIVPPEIENRALAPQEVCQVLDLSKSTLFRWEQDGVTPEPHRTYARLVAKRQYSMNDLVNIIEHQKKNLENKRRRGIPIGQSWLDEYNRDADCDLVTPSGFTIRIRKQREI